MTKEALFTWLGALGAAIAGYFGGWDTSMTTLLIFMAIDYLSGIICAGVFNASPKTPNGALESRAGYKGLIRKGMILLIILIAARIDILLGTTYFRDGCCIAFILNELLSIIENAGLMGVPIPAPIQKAIEVLKAKSEVKEDSEDPEE